MSDAQRYPSVPLTKGRPGQIAFMRVRILGGGDRPNSIAVAPINKFGQPCTNYELVEYYVGDDSIVTMQEAKRAAQG